VRSAPGEACLRAGSAVTGPPVAVTPAADAGCTGACVGSASAATRGSAPLDKELDGRSTWYAALTRKGKPSMRQSDN